MASSSSRTAWRVWITVRRCNLLTVLQDAEDAIRDFDGRDFMGERSASGRIDATSDSRFQRIIVQPSRESRRQRDDYYE